jgi:hypothetical protein
MTYTFPSIVMAVTQVRRLAYSGYSVTAVVGIVIASVYL